MAFIKHIRTRRGIDGLVLVAALSGAMLGPIAATLIADAARQVTTCADARAVQHPISEGQ